MRNGEVKHYRGKDITKVNSKCWTVPGFLITFDNYYAAKEAIDAMHAEDDALARADSYVRDVCGGYI